MEMDDTVGALKSLRSIQGYTHFSNFEMLDARIASVLNKIIQNSHLKKPDDVLESLYKSRIRESDQLNTALELYDTEIHQKISVPNYRKLKTMVNIDARHGRIETGAVVNDRKELIGVEGGKGICYQWKEKGQCSLCRICADIASAFLLRILVVGKKHWCAGAANGCRCQSGKGF